jgi:hypothetical protein
VRTRGWIRIVVMTVGVQRRSITIRWTSAKVGSSASLVLVPSSISRADHDAGLRSSLENLATFLAT